MRTMISANYQHVGITLFLIILCAQFSQAQSITPKVAVNYGNSYVLNEEGEVYSFGHNQWGGLGQGNINRADIFGAVDLSNLGGKKIWKLGEGISSTHQLLIAEDSTLIGYGFNNKYPLGSSVSTGEILAPVQLNPAALAGRKVVQAVQTDGLSYALTDSGYVFAAGEDPNDYAGLGTTTSSIQSFTQIDPAGFNGEKIVKISSSTEHRLFLSENGNVFAVGQNFNGELSTNDGSGTHSTPVPIVRTNVVSKTVADIATADQISMLLTEDGSVFTSGKYNSGALGIDNLTQDVKQFTEVDQTNIAGKTMVQIAMGTDSAFMLSSDGMLYGMGGESIAGLVRKNGSFIGSDIPIKLLDSSALDGTITAFSLGGRNDGAVINHLILKTDTGKLYAFGRSDRGQTGTGYTTYLESPKPLNLSEVQSDSIVQFTGGHFITFLQDSNGSVYSAGYGRGGFNYVSGDARELTGRSAIQGVATPAKMDLSNLTGKTVIDVIPGTKHAFLLTESGDVYGTGRAAGAQLGTADSVDVSIPEKIDHLNIGGKKIIKVASGGTTDEEKPQGHTLLLAEDGTLFSFGSNESGQLGLGDRSTRWIPTEITDASITSKTIVDIDANGRHSLFIADDGTVFLSGFGGNGEMGFGDSNDRLVPTELTHANLSGVTIVEGALGMTSSDGSNLHVVLRSGDNRLFSFGNGTVGQLAQGVEEDSYNPTEISASSYDNKTPVALEAGDRTTMVRMADGSLFGAGRVHTIGFDVLPFTDFPELTPLEGDLNHRFVTDMNNTRTYAIALLDDGTVLTFGNLGGGSGAYYGSLGNGEPKPSDHRTPTEVENFTVLSSPIPTTNLALHLDAGKGFTQSGDTISVWANLAGSQNAFENMAENRPKVAQNVINNRRTVRFDGLDNSLTLPSATDLGITNSDYEVFIVAQSATVNTDISFLMAGGAEQFELHLNGSAGSRFIPKTGTFIDQAAIGAYSDATAHLFNPRATSSTALNSVSRNSSEVSVNAQSSYTGDLFLGKRADSTFFFNGFIGEVIIYNNVLSDADRGRVEDYLYAKYGLVNKINESFTLTGTEGWRLLAQPVADSSLAPLLSDLWTQGFPGSDSPDNGTPNVFTWDTTTATATGDNSGWKVLSNMNDTMQPGTAALVYVFSDDNHNEPGDAGFPKTLTVSGVEPLGMQDLSANLNPNENGFALIGNPFRYDINWGSFSKEGLSNAVYVYDHNAAGWKSWNGTAGDLTDGTIGAYNGFFVETMGAEPTLEIPDSAKTYKSERFLGKEVEGAEPQFFSLELAGEAGFTNKAWVQFSEVGESGLDANDARKLVPLSSRYVSVASLTNENEALDINNLPLQEEVFEIPLEINTTESGTHTLSLKDVNFPDSWTIELIDHETSTHSELSEAYVFTIAQNKTVAANAENPATPPTISSFISPVTSQATDRRFSLNITRSQVVSNESDPNLPQKVELGQNYPNPFNPSTTIEFGVPESGQVTLEVFNMLGRKVSTLINRENKSAGRYSIQFDAGRLASGIYLYRLKTGNTVITKKLTLIK